MEKSKLVQLLLTFSKEELRELAKFAAAPFFNPRPEALKPQRTLARRCNVVTYYSRGFADNYSTDFSFSTLASRGWFFGNVDSPSLG